MFWGEEIVCWLLKARRSNLFPERELRGEIIQYCKKAKMSGMLGNPIPTSLILGRDQVRGVWNARVFGGLYCLLQRKTCPFLLWLGGGLEECIASTVDDCDGDGTDSDFEAGR